MHADGQRSQSENFVARRGNRSGMPVHSSRKLKGNCNEMEIECAAATLTCYRSLDKVTDGQVIVRSVVMSLIYEL